MNTGLSVDKENLQKQFAFILEADKMKEIFRQNYLANAARKENDAEHSWHLALMAILLRDHFPARNVDLNHVLKMVLIHDLVEIDAGDTYAYDEKAALDREVREKAAAGRLYGMLPAEQGRELREIWEEFEAERTPESRFAVVLDRIQPFLLNFASQGRSWQEHGIRKSQLIARYKPVREYAPELWTSIEGMIDEAVKKGYLNE